MVGDGQPIGHLRDSVHVSVPPCPKGHPIPSRKTKAARASNGMNLVGETCFYYQCPRPDRCLADNLTDFSSFVII